MNEGKLGDISWKFAKPPSKRLVMILETSWSEHQEKYWASIIPSPFSSVVPDSHKVLFSWGDGDHEDQGLLSTYNKECEGFIEAIVYTLDTFIKFQLDDGDI